MRAVGSAVLARTVVRMAPRAGAVSALVAAGALAWAWAGGVSLPVLAALAAAALLASALALLPRRPAGAEPVVAAKAPSPVWAFLLGAAAIAALAALAHAALSLLGLHDLGSAFADGAQAIVLRLACATAAFGVLYGVARLAGGTRAREGWAWSSAGLL